MPDTSLKKIPPADLVPMDVFTGDFPLHIDLAYAHDHPPNIFGIIYHKAARLWLHRDLASVVLLAAQLIHKDSGLHLRLYDGLRTVEAQAKMQNSPVARKNPHWLEEPGRLLSPPGMGGHPRGMAVDLTLQTADGALLDMGTVFDHLAEDSSAAHNPAHRNHPGQTPEVRKNRKILTAGMLEAAKLLGVRLVPLAEEWWDFRLQPETYNAFEPLSDSGLPPAMRMTDPKAASHIHDFPDSHFERLKHALAARVETARQLR